jgi:uncharacterized membrane protein
MLIVLVLFYLSVPFLILHLCRKYRFINKLGSVVVAYIVGIVLGNVGILPEKSHLIHSALTSATIPFAISLMLFSTNLVAVFKLARNTILSFAIGLVSVTVMIITGYYMFQESIPEAWKVGGLLVGVYTGGTPNLAALKLILDVDETLYLITHSADLLIGVFYLFFLLTVGKSVFSLVLRSSGNKGKEQSSEQITMDEEPYLGLLKRRMILPVFRAIFLALLVVATSFLVSLIVPPNSQMAFIMLLITTQSLALSFIPKVNKIPKTFELGFYFVLVFSVVVASMATLTSLMESALEVLYYVSWVVFGSLLLQVLISKLFRIDVETVIVTSTALICSPPFVPVVAGAMGSKNLIVPGLTIGIAGYAVGNYLGFLMAQFLR